MRSCLMRLMSTSALTRVESRGKRAVSAKRSPHSKIAAWPSHARSVVDSPGDRLLDRGDQRVLKKEIVNGIGGQTELREHHECGVQLISSPCQANGLLEVCRNSSNPGAGHARGNANEIMTVERLETRHETCSAARVLAERFIARQLSISIRLQTSRTWQGQNEED